MVSKHKLKSFSLFELLIVTFIISLVYAMFAINFKTTEEEGVSLKTFKEYIAKKKYKKYIKLTCLENEKFCRLHIDGNDEYESLYLFENNKEIIVYDFDKDDELKELTFGYFKNDDTYDEIPIVLNMYFYESNKHKPYLVDNGKNVVYFSIFKDIVFFKNLGEATEFFISNKENLLEIYRNKLRK